jgi:hypothetical protein
MSWIFIWYAHADYVDLTDTENVKWFLCIIKGHSYSQENQKKRNTGSKKLGCTAAVYMREIVFFPEYKVM